MPHGRATPVRRRPARLPPVSFRRIPACPLPGPRRLVGALLAVALTAAAAVAATAAIAPGTAAAATSQSHGYLLAAGPHLAKGRGHEWMGS